MDYLANFRRLTAVEILDAASEIYRGQFAVLALIAVCVMLPTSVLAVFSPPDLAPLVDRFGNLFLPIGEGAIAIAVVAALSGTPIGVREAFRRLYGRFGTIINAAIASGLMIFVGILLLVVPGMIAFVWTAVVIPIVAIEELPVGKAIERSRHLARGNGVHIFATVGLAWLLMLVIAIGVSFGTDSLAAFVGIGARGRGLFSDAVFAVIFPFISVVTTFLYLDLRVRRDGADIEALAAALPPSASPAGGSTVQAIEG